MNGFKGDARSRLVNLATKDAYCCHWLNQDAGSRLANLAMICIDVIDQTITLKDILDRHRPCKDLLNLIINQNYATQRLQILVISPIMSSHDC